VPSYELTGAADQDLADIYAFSFIEFGERQADSYFDSLESCLTQLAESPGLGRSASFVRQGYRVFVHQRHSIYYRPTQSGILVVRVLGPGMMREAYLP